MKPSDPLGELIDRNMPAWEQRQANYKQMVDAFGNPTVYSRDDDVLLAAGPGYNGGTGQSDRDRNIARMLEMANRPDAGSMESIRQPDGTYRVEIADIGSSVPSVTYPVTEQSLLQAEDLAPLVVAGTGLRNSAADPFSLVTPDYYVKPGVVSNYYQNQVAQFSDPSQPWHVRSLSFINATLTAPVMLFEEGGRGIMNVPYAGSQLGQHAVIFNQATDVDTKVIAGLSMVKFGSEGFVNTYAGGVLGRQVYVQAQDEAVSYWLKQQVNGDVRKFNEVYTSAVDGTRRLGYSLDGVTGYRAHNTEVMATKAREYMSLQRPVSPADAIERSALSPLFGSTPNLATELYQVTTRSGFYFKGQVAPQSGWYQGAPFSLGGGNTQVFMPALPNPAGGYPIAPWASGAKKVPYGNQ